MGAGQVPTGQVEILTARATGLEARLAEPVKSPDNSSRPSSEGKKPSQVVMERWQGSRKGSLGRNGAAVRWPKTPGDRGARSVRRLLIEAALPNLQVSTR